MIRIIGSAATGGTVSGTRGFTSCFASHTWSATSSASSAVTGETVLNSTQIPAHHHNISYYLGTLGGGMYNKAPYPIPAVVGTPGSQNNPVSGAVGGADDPHSHPFTVPSVTNSSLGTTNFSIQYVNTILCIAS